MSHSNKSDYEEFMMGNDFIFCLLSFVFIFIKVILIFFLDKLIGSENGLDGTNHYFKISSDKGFTTCIEFHYLTIRLSEPRWMDCSLKMISGSHEDMLKLIPSLAIKIVKKNLESIIKYKVDDESHFQRFFVSL